MKTYTGSRLGIGQDHQDQHTQRELQRLWKTVGDLDQWAKHASRGFGRISAGETPDSSGGPVVPPGSAFALTGVSDTNLTLSLGGSPTVALLAPVSLTLGWAGLLGVSRGGTAKGSWTAGSVVFAGLGGTALAEDNAGLFYDDTMNFLGVNTATPVAGVHVRANPATVSATLLPSSNSAPAEWTGNASDLASDDEATSIVFTEQGGATVRASRFLLNGTVNNSLISWSVALSIKSTGSSDPAGSLVVEIVRADGQAYTGSMVLSEFTTSWTDETVVVSTVGASGQTANSIKLTLTTTTGFPSTRYDVSYAAVTQSVAGATQAVSIFDQTATAAGPFTLWRNSAGVIKASVDLNGAGQFKNVLLEEPGSGVGTITLKAPVGVSSYALELPANDGDANEVMVTNGSGVMDWVPLSSLAGSFAGFAIPSVDIDVTAEDAGVATTAIRSDARLQLSQAITPTWSGVHTFNRSVNITGTAIESGLKITPFIDQTQVAFGVYQAADALAMFHVAPTGVVTIGSTSHTDDITRLSVRVPTTQSAANILEVVRGTYTAWSMGSTGINVFGDTTAAAPGVIRMRLNQATGQSVNIMEVNSSGGSPLFSISSAGKQVNTLAPQIDIASAATNLALTATDADGNSIWSQLSLTAGVTGVLPVANGGSNKALTLSAGGILWTDADSFEVLAAGTAGQVLQSGGAATPAWLTLGSFATISSLAFASLTSKPTTFAGYGISDTSANLNTAITDNTGSGALVFGTAPTITGTSAAPLLVTGSAGTGIVRIGQWDVVSNAYAGFSLHGAFSSTMYTMLASPGDNNLYFNRPTGGNIHFRSNGSNQVYLDGVGAFYGISKIGGDLFVDGTLTLGTSIEISNADTGDRYATIDFHSSDAVDFSSRVSRSPGLNGNLVFENTGNGIMAFSQVGTGPVVFLGPGNGPVDVGIGTSGPTATLHVVGSVKFGRSVFTTATYTMDSGAQKDYVIAAATMGTPAARTVNLPLAATAGDGRIVVIKDETGNAQTYNITIDASGAELIDGSTTQVISSNYGSRILYCTGTTWHISGAF